MDKADEYYKKNKKTPSDKEKEELNKILEDINKLTHYLEKRMNRGLTKEEFQNGFKIGE